MSPQNTNMAALTLQVNNGKKKKKKNESDSSKKAPA